MANVWFLSDLHLSHKNICKFRPIFDSVEQHNQVIKDNYHKVVTKRDKVFFLGDIAFSKESLEDVKTWVAEKKVLIVGNHDTDHHSMKDLCEVFDEVYSLYKYKGMWLSHAPIHASELRGKLNLHGHTHYVNVDDPRYLNVSMEQIDFTPIDLNEVRNRFNKQLGGCLKA